MLKSAYLLHKCGLGDFDMSSTVFIKSELKPIAAALISQKFEDRKGGNASFSFLVSLPLY